MNNIFVWSRQKFKEELKTMNEQAFASSAFISIHSPNVGLSFNDTEPILSDCDNVLNLWFHDIDPEQEREWVETNPPYQEVLFDEEMAVKIKEFVLRNISAKKWVIHCTAGICRSGAVGEVLSEFFNIPYFEFKRVNPQIRPNIYVKNVLKSVLYDK